MAVWDVIRVIRYVNYAVEMHVDSSQELWTSTNAVLPHKHNMSIQNPNSTATGLFSLGLHTLADSAKPCCLRLHVNLNAEMKDIQIDPSHG